jgi:PhnB protein
MPPIGMAPYITISAAAGGAKKALAWYKAGFRANVKAAYEMSCGGEGETRIGHAELMFGSTMFMLSDAWPGMGKTPQDLGGVPVTFTIMYPKGISKMVYDNAVKNGATVPEGREYKEQPWGWEAGTILDPFGYQWTIGEDVKGWSDEEIGKQLKMKIVTDEI